MASSAPRSILFLCSLNAVRSPTAEALARRLLPSAYVASAGVRAGDRDPFVDAVLAEIGLTLADRRPRRLDELEDDYFEMIVTLSPPAHHAALELTRAMAVEVEYWPTPDPTASGGTRDRILAAYRDMRDRLETRIRQRFPA